MDKSLLSVPILMSLLFATVEAFQTLHPGSCRLRPPCTVCRRSFLRHPSDLSQFGICYMGKFFGYIRCPNRTLFSQVWNICQHRRRLPEGEQKSRTRNKDNCGVSIQSLVVGGHRSSLGEWPWQVSLMERRFHVCGGTLVNEQWVITAAHCVFRKRRLDLQVALGNNILYKDAANTVFRSVAMIYIHPYYTNGGSYPNDIALLKLSSPVFNTGFIRPVCLPSKWDHFTPIDKCWITGWGETLGTAKKYVLNELQVQITSLPECQRNWAIYAHRNHICVGDGRVGPCRGDSGGPLVCLRNGRFVLAGVASFGNELCQIRAFPAIYTSVIGFIEWIHDIIARN